MKTRLRVTRCVKSGLEDYIIIAEMPNEASYATEKLV